MYNNGIEAIEHVNTRVMEFIHRLKSLKKRNPQNQPCGSRKIIVVSHSAFLDCLFAEMFGLPLGALGKIENCSISYCVFNRKRFKMITNPNTEHLVE